MPLLWQSRQLIEHHIALMHNASRLQEKSIALLRRARTLCDLVQSGARGIRSEQCFASMGSRSTVQPVRRGE
jgi:hypothetical protein